ncbi:MAG: PGPGW domain-containing protein [Bacteroidetes bacterium]|nr:PGPGW domain-containing protein [Bacteroidota bacterium]
MTNNRIINLTVGWSFILLGIAGSVLPVLQGFLFFVVGLLFLSREYHWAHRLLEWLKQWTAKRLPRAYKVFDAAEQFLIREVERMTHEPGYLLRRSWIILAVLVGLGLIGWLLESLVVWLWRLVR